MKRDILRARTGARYLLIAAVCAAAATACGSTAAPASSPAAAPKVSLNIKVSSAHTSTRNWTLTCDPAGGTHPNPAAACNVLLKAKNPFAPVAKGVMCPMIVAGQKVAVVKGTYFGQHVDTTFTQSGCALPRWAKIGQIFN